MPPNPRPIPRFIADSTQEGIPHGRFAERLGEAFRDACKEIEDLPEGIDLPCELDWYPDRAWGGRVWVPCTARTEGPEGAVERHGRVDIAAFAAKQVISQRLRDIADDAVLGEFRGKEGDIVAGVVQQGPNPRMVHVDLGSVEAILPPEEQVAGEERACRPNTDTRGRRSSPARPGTWP